MRYPYAFHVALDGNGINGFEGLAGVCQFRLDPETREHAYKVRYFDGIAGGHAVSVNPAGTVGFLGNASQQLLFYDARTLEEITRISTLRFEPADTSLRGTTHVVWLDASSFLACLGGGMYRFSLNALDQPERIGDHGLMLPHAMKRTASGRYVAIGSMDHPTRGPACELGLWDVQEGTMRRVELPTTCWHLAAHPTEDLVYAVSFRVFPQSGADYLQWGMAFLKEYVYEVCARTGRVVRHWATSRETPAHINSDVCVSDDELIFCTGGSQSIVCVDRKTLAAHRIIDERPGLAEQARRPRTVATQVFDSMVRGDVFTNARQFLGALRVSRFSLIDSVYACQLSADQRWLFTANRGLNRITVYRYPDAEPHLRVQMPDLQRYLPSVGALADPRLGFHHSYLVEAGA